MSNEQNLDEMLRSLQESVDNLKDGEADTDEGSEVGYADISTADLQKQLEEKYFSEGVSGKHESDGSYELNSDFLAEFSMADGEGMTDTEDVTDTDVTEQITAETDVSPSVEEESEPTAVEDEVIPADEESEEELAIQTDGESFDEDDGIELFQDESDDGEELDDLAELCELESCFVPSPKEEELHIEYSSPVALLVEDETDEDVDLISEEELFDDEIFEEEIFEEEIFEELDVIDSQTELGEEPLEEEISSADEPETETPPVFDEFASYPKEKPKSFKAIMMDYGRPDPIPSPKVIEEELETVTEEEEETPDVGDILSDFADDSPTEEDRMNTAVRHLMTSLGCEDELESVSAEDIGAIYGQCNEERCENETVSAETVEKKRNTYKKGIFIASLKLAACVIMTVFMFLYDTLPIFDVEFLGLSDYVLYPGAYVMIGTQLLLICAVCLWRSMWNGIKGLLTVYPNVYSVAVVSVAAVIVYDTVFFLTGSYKPLETPMFHFVCGVYLTLIALYGLIMRIREAKAYDLYSADVAKFTFTYDKSSHSIGEKMYSGGFSKDKKIYATSPVSCPKGFFSAIQEDGSFKNGIFSSLILMSVGIGVIFGIALMIAGLTLEESAVAAISVIMTAMPVTAVMAIAIPMSISGARLKKRGIALTGRKMIRKYGADNAIIFSDMHLFGKCDPKQVGFVCYEAAQTKNVLAALNILYSRIGGPMGEVFANIPEQYAAKSIRVRRITRSGIEAVIDRSHTLVVGDADFLKRYGIDFTAVSKGSGKNATLYVSLDGRASARLTAVYRIEPVFDMLIERLAADGIHCVIETYDPMINTAFAAKHRKAGRSPISVVHKNAADINRTTSNAKKRSDHGILALSSRLKLAEAAVWCARLCKIEKISNIVIYAATGLGVALVLLPALFAAVPCFVQYLLFLYMLCVIAALVAITLGIMPRKNYFTVSAIEREDAEREERKKQEERKDK